MRYESEQVHKNNSLLNIGFPCWWHGLLDVRMCSLLILFSCFQLWIFLFKTACIMFNVYVYVFVLAFIFAHLRQHRWRGCNELDLGSAQFRLRIGELQFDSKRELFCFDELRTLVDCGYWRASNDPFQLFIHLLMMISNVSQFLTRAASTIHCFFSSMPYNQNKGEMFKQKSISVQSTELTREWLSSRSKAIITFGFPCKPFFERQHETIFLCKNIERCVVVAIFFFHSFFAPLHWLFWCKPLLMSQTHLWCRYKMTGEIFFIITRRQLCAYVLMDTVANATVLLFDQTRFIWIDGSKNQVKTANGKWQMADMCLSACTKTQHAHLWTMLHHEQRYMSMSMYCV